MTPVVGSVIVPGCLISTYGWFNTGSTHVAVTNIGAPDDGEVQGVAVTGAAADPVAAIGITEVASIPAANTNTTRAERPALTPARTRRIITIAVPIPHIALQTFEPHF